MELNPKDIIDLIPFILGNLPECILIIVFASAITYIIIKSKYKKEFEKFSNLIKLNNKVNELDNKLYEMSCKYETLEKMNTMTNHLLLSLLGQNTCSSKEQTDLKTNIDMNCKKTHIDDKKGKRKKVK